MKIIDKLINAYEYNLHKIQEYLDNQKDVVITNRYNSDRWIFFFVDNQNNALALRMIGQPFILISIVNSNKVFYYFNGVTFNVSKSLEELKDIAKKEPEIKDSYVDTSTYEKKTLHTLFGD